MSNHQTDQDTRLILRIKEGDTSAFRQLVDKHKDVSLSLACSILKDTQTAEDVLQDVFMKVYSKIDTFQFKSSFTTWLYRIVVNMSYNALKRMKHHEEIDTMITLGSEDKKGMETADIEKYVSLALQLLKRDESLVLRLFYLCELKIGEIQKITGFSSSKVKMDLHRGRQHMEKQLERLLGDELKHLL